MFQLSTMMRTDAVFLAEQLLGAREHGLRRLPVQEDDAEQGET